MTTHVPLLAFFHAGIDDALLFVTAAKILPCLGARAFFNPVKPRPWDGARADQREASDRRGRASNDLIATGVGDRRAVPARLDHDGPRRMRVDTVGQRSLDRRVLADPGGSTISAGMQ